MKKFNVIVLILGFILNSGCANPRLLLTKNQKKLPFKNNEGGIIFSLETQGVPFRPASVFIQEVNQYKEYKKKPLVFVPMPGDVSKDIPNISYYNIKLPQGTYRIASFFGFLGGFWTGTHRHVSCNKIFDVKKGRVTYGGRLKTMLALQRGVCINEVKVKDFYDGDISFLKNKYTILGNTKVEKDLIY